MTRSVVAYDFESFRLAARQLAAAGIRPSEIVWQDPAQQQADLFGAFTSPAELPVQAGSAVPRVPRRFVELAEIAVLYRSADRFELLYRVLYRLTHGEPQLLEDEVDSDVRALSLRVQSVRKDEHRMHAFVRFRKLQLEAAECFVAWYAPEHHILRLAAPFFERRFAAMRWSILTPDESAHWDGERLQYGPGAPRSQAPQEDELETLFRTYYSATYNPARANLPLLRKHIPAAFARHMPELDQLPVLMQERAQAQGEAAASAGDSAAPLVPTSLRSAKLHEHASRAWPASARSARDARRALRGSRIPRA
jgi:probable DNA metabolism protein